MMRGISATVVLVCVLACGVGSAAADDVIRLGGSGSLSDAAVADTMRLDGALMDDAQVQPVHRWGWGGYRHGWGHGWGGRGWYGGFYGGYRPFYSSYYRPYWGGWGGYYRPYAWGGWGGYYRPYYSSLYYSSLSYPSYSYYYPSYSYYSYPVYSFYAPCAADSLVMPEATTLGSGSAAARVQRLPTMPRADESGAGSDGTYDYNGGPQRVVPLPGSTSAPLVAPPPRPMLPRQGKLASLPAAESFEFRAYGEKETTPQQPAVRVTTGAAPALAFPAYGETTSGTTVLTGAR